MRNALCAMRYFISGSTAVQQNGSTAKRQHSNTAARENFKKDDPQNL
jgi:hypothetical protein